MRNNLKKKKKKPPVFINVQFFTGFWRIQMNFNNVVGRWVQWVPRLCHWCHFLSGLCRCRRYSGAAIKVSYSIESYGGPETVACFTWRSSIRFYDLCITPWSRPYLASSTSSTISSSSFFLLLSALFRFSAAPTAEHSCENPCQRIPDVRFFSLK